MGAIWKGRKRFFVRFESDQRICGSQDHFGGNAGSLKSAKTLISHIKDDYIEYNPRNFRVFDSFADVDPQTNHVPCVYRCD